MSKLFAQIIKLMYLCTFLISHLTMINLSQIFPSGYRNIPTEEDLHFEVQEILCHCENDKQIIDALRRIRCPYMRKATTLCLQEDWHQLMQLRDDRTGYYDSDGDWRNAWVYFDSDMRQIIKMANHEQVLLEAQAPPSAPAPTKLVIQTTTNMNKEKPNYHINMENCNVIMGDSIGGFFTLPGSQVTVNQSTNANGQTQQQILGPTESLEDRLARKQAAIKDMCNRLYNLEEDMLGYGPEGKRIGYTQLSTLLHKVLGMSEVGSKPEYRAIQEGIWTILIDQRAKCSKDPKDLYFHQTFLGLVGYLLEKQLIHGRAQKILDCLYAKNDQSMLKNLQRGLVSAFPSGTDQMIDFYIAHLRL